jgi:hypothetical protein
MLGLSNGVKSKVKSFFTIAITHHPLLFPISPFFSNSIDPVVVLLIGP